METRDLGRTGMKISRIVFGCGAVGGVIFKTGMDQSVDAVRRGLAHGINWFDTAASYGDGQSEERLGQILRELQVTPRVSTKVALQPEEMVDIPGAIRRGLEASLGRLGQNRVDLFQLHNAITPDRGDRRNSVSIQDVLGTDGVAETMARLREEGLFDAAGFTGSGDTSCLIQTVDSGLFDTVQTHFSLNNPSAIRPVPAKFSPQNFDGYATRAASQGMGVLNIRVLGAGVLAGKQLRDGPGIVPGADGAQENARAAKLKEAFGVDDQGLYRIALRFAVMQREISGVLIGFSTPDHVDKILTPLREGNLSSEELGTLDNLYAEPPFTGR